MKTTFLSGTAAAVLLSQIVTVTAMAASLTVSPSIVTNDFTGKITLTISGLPAPGRTVIVERYADFDNDGLADAAEPILQAFTVTDGQVPTIGGIRNINAPGDEDGAVNGQIRAEIRFPGSDATLDRIAGNFVFKVTDPTPGGFAPVTQRFSIRQKTQAQGVTGRITAASTGLPLANTVVVLLVPDGPGGVGALVDANGDFSIHSTPGDFVVAAIRPGYVVDPSVSMVTISSNQFSMKNVALSNGMQTVSGRVMDADSGDGVPGVFLFAEAASGEIAVGNTDSAGDYSIQIMPGEWEIRPNQSQAAIQGYVAFGDHSATTITGSASNVNFQLPKATALIYGRLADDGNQPLPGVGLRADEPNLEYQASGRSYPTNGDYALAVVAGSWWVEPEHDDPALRGWDPLESTCRHASLSIL